MPEFNILAAVAAGIAGWLVGAVWYSPVLFAKVWQRETGLSDEQLGKAHMPLIFGTSLVLSVIAALVFAMFLGPDPALALGLGAGIAAGLGWVATSFGINYLFSRRSLTLFVIDGGYHTLQFTVFGLVLGLWH
jgi:hypothetical protein